MNDLTTLDYAYLGQPFANGKNDPTINLDTLDYALDAQPFNGDSGGSTPPVEEFIPWFCLL